MRRIENSALHRIVAAIADVGDAPAFRRTHTSVLSPSASAWSMIAPANPSCSIRMRAWRTVVVAVTNAPADFKRCSYVHSDKRFILDNED